MPLGLSIGNDERRTTNDFDAIQLGADVTLTGAYGYYYGSDTGLPVITSAMSIDGNGHTIARDTNYAPFRLMAVGPTGDLTLEDVTLTGGDSLNGGGALINGRWTTPSATTRPTLAGPSITSWR